MAPTDTFGRDLPTSLRIPYYLRMPSWRTSDRMSGMLLRLIRRPRKVVWQVVTGAEGLFNNDYLPGALGPYGIFYQGVLDGVVTVRDGKSK